MRTVYRNMKRGSSSSSGSEKLTSIGVITGGAFSAQDRDDRKVTKSNSSPKMSCTSDDSCAINELIEGRMDLKVILPHRGCSAVINVERRTPMMDLLVGIATQYRFNAANYTISAGEHEFKASTPIGSLDVNEISIVAKQGKSTKPQVPIPSQTPFEPTFRLQVNLPRNQLMVIRVKPNTPIGEIKNIVCSEKSLDPNYNQLVRMGAESTPQLLDINKTLAYYTLNEVTLISNKSLSQMGLRIDIPIASSVMELKRGSSVTAPNSSTPVKPSFSHSTPDISGISYERSISSKSTKSVKRQAPPPPQSPLSASVIRSEVSSDMNKTQTKVKSGSTIETLNEDDEPRHVIIKSAASEPYLAQTKIHDPVMKAKNGIGNHVRHNSGSDSSGYHESVLSSDSPESSSAGAAGKSCNNNVNNRQRSGSKTTISSISTKKRRAPPPPNQVQTNIKNNQQHEFDIDKDRNLKNINKNNNDSDGDQKVAHTSIECMSDVSLPASTSSASSSGAVSASSINNKSLSPIVITHANGSSTPNGAKTMTPQPSLPSMDSIESTYIRSTSASPSPIIPKEKEPSEKVRSSSAHVSKGNHMHNDEIHENELTNKDIALDTCEIRCENDYFNNNNGINDTLKGENHCKHHDDDGSARPQLIEQHDYHNDNGDNYVKESKESQFNGQSGLTVHTSSNQQFHSFNNTNTNTMLNKDTGGAISVRSLISPIKEMESAPTRTQSAHTNLVAPLNNRNAHAPGDGHDIGPNTCNVNDCMDDTSKYSDHQTIGICHLNKGMTMMMVAYNSCDYMPPPPEFGDGIQDIASVMGASKCLMLQYGEDEVNYREMNERDNDTNANASDCESDTIQTDYNDYELVADMSLPLPPPSPFRNSDGGDDINDIEKDGHGEGVGGDVEYSMGQYADNDNNDITLKVNSEVNKTSGAQKGMGVETISDTMKESETTPVVVHDDEEKLKREIEVTLQSFSDELEEIECYNTDEELDDVNSVELTINDHKDKSVPKDFNTIVAPNDQQIKSVANSAGKISVHVTHDNSPRVEQQMFDSKPAIRERSITPSSKSSSSTMSLSPSPELITSNGRSTVIVNRAESSASSASQSVSPSSSGKTTVILNKSPSPTPPPPSVSPIATPRSVVSSPEDKNTLTTEEVRKLCRPKVQLTNFKIGTYKKEVDIYADTDSNIVKSSKTNSFNNNRPPLDTVKPVIVTASLKQDNQSYDQHQRSQETKSNVKITSNVNQSQEKIFPIIQTLVTAAPKATQINRIQSWSGVRNFTIEKRNATIPFQQPKERCVSQVAFNKDSIKVSIKNPSALSQPKLSDELKTTKFGDDFLKSPQLVVQTLAPRDGHFVKHGSVSTYAEVFKEKEQQQVHAPKLQINQKQKQPLHTTISIKQSVTNAQNNNNNIDEKIPEMRTMGKRNSLQAYEDQRLGVQNLHHALQKQIRQYHENSNGNNSNGNNSNGNNSSGSINNQSQSIYIGKSSNANVQLGLNQNQSNHTSSLTNNFSTPPPPPPLPQHGAANNNRFKSATIGSGSFKSAIGITAPIGWKSIDKSKGATTMRNVTTNVPNVKRFESAPSGLNQRDAMLNEIREFGGRNSLKKVSQKNSSWQLQVHGNSVTS